MTASSMTRLLTMDLGMHLLNDSMVCNTTPLMCKSKEDDDEPQAASFLK